MKDVGPCGTAPDFLSQSLPLPLTLRTGNTSPRRLSANDEPPAAGKIGGSRSRCHNTYFLLTMGKERAKLEVRLKPGFQMSEYPNGYSNSFFGFWWAAVPYRPPNAELSRIRGWAVRFGPLFFTVWQICTCCPAIVAPWFSVRRGPAAGSSPAPGPSCT